MYSRIFLTLSFLLALAPAWAEVPADEIFSSITDKVIRLEDLFYKPHLNTGYHPIKLEAALYDPINVDLEFVLTKAIEDNINLGIAKQDSLIAKWKFWQQFSEALPDFSLSAQKKNFDGTFFLNTNFSSPIDESQSQANFRIDYRVFDGGKTSFLALAERHYKNAAAEDEHDQYNQVLYDTVSLYNELFKDQVKLGSKLKALEEAQSDLDLASKFLKAGTGTKFDVFQAEARLARAQQGLIEQEAQFRVSEIQLAEHLNMPLLTPLRIEEEDARGLHRLEIIADDLNIDEFIKTANDQSPRVKAALKRKRGALREGIAKVGDFLPKLDIYADYTGTGQSFGDLNRITTLGGQVTLELGKGSGVSTFSDVMEGRANVRKAKLLYRQEQIRIEKELRMAFLDFEKSKSLLHASEKELIASRESLKLARLRYKNGREILARVLEKETELADAEVKMIDSIANYNLAQANIAYLMGSISIADLLKT